MPGIAVILLFLVPWAHGGDFEPPLFETSIDATALEHAPADISPDEYARMIAVYRERLLRQRNAKLEEEGIVPQGTFTIKVTTTTAKPTTAAADLGAHSQSILQQQVFFYSVAFTTSNSSQVAVINRIKTAATSSERAELREQWRRMLGVDRRRLEKCSLKRNTLSQNFFLV